MSTPIVKENPVTYVSPDGSVVKMERMGLFVTVQIAVSIRLGKKRVIVGIKAQNLSTGATYYGRDVVVRKKAIKTAMAIWRERQEKIEKEGIARSRVA